MAIKKQIPIKYTDRDFLSIREALLEHAQRYYPSTFQDFNEAGFGSLMLDTVAYVGDVLSFYLDYQANECFLETANEEENILKIGKQLGFKLKPNPSSHGIATFYVTVPSISSGFGPDTDYIPVLKKGTTVASINGNMFTLNEDVRFDREDSEIVVAEVNDTTGVPTSYAIKGFGQIISGRLEEEFIQITEFEKFLKVVLEDVDIAEVVLVEDESGNEYFEVDYLSQDVIYRPVTNRDPSTAARAPFLLKPYSVPRRFVVDREGEDVILQFGSGTVKKSIQEKIADPSQVILQVHGKDYVSDTFFDPTKLIHSDKFGIAPSNTVLRVVYRVNTSDMVNAGANTITDVIGADMEFNDPSILDPETISTIISSLEADNEEPIVGDVSLPDIFELKRRIIDNFSSQGRAVTASDYQALSYSMPPQFGSIKRVSIIRDPNSVKRNLNLYIVSEDEEGLLVKTNSAIKKNLKTWLNQNRMINDTIDILDARIVNLGIDFVAIGDLEKNKYDTLEEALILLREFYINMADIGEPFFVTDIYKILRDVEGIVDVLDVNVERKSGGLYADTKYNINNNFSKDGRYIICPENVILEIKYPDIDIKGVIR